MISHDFPIVGGIEVGARRAEAPLRVPVVAGGRRVAPESAPQCVPDPLWGIGLLRGFKTLTAKDIN